MKYPIDRDTVDEVRTMHKRTVYVNEQRKEWWEEYSRRDEEYCFNKKLEETIDLMSSLSLSDWMGKVIYNMGYIKYYL